ncbi:hypothetical protein AB0I28_32200 [Phytomonospora sp. NPDC050363]|uniref:hypothetical protein n=1 Tax=Phytomonospora sp. NPDC050363 TaxID=3155642 RepID=UPI0033DA65BF
MRWLCYEWNGAAASLTDDAQRQLPHIQLPPNVVRDWLHKPDAMRSRTCHSIDEAMDWLDEKINLFAPHALGGSQLEHELSLNPYSRQGLLAGKDVVRSMWLTGSRALRLAIITEHPTAGIVDADPARTAEALSPVPAPRDTDLDHVGSF